MIEGSTTWPIIARHNFTPLDLSHLCLSLGHSGSSGSARRALDAQQNFLAIFQLVHEFLVELELLRRHSNRPTRLSVSKRSCNHLTQRPSRQAVVFVNMGDKQALRRENDFGVIVEVELGKLRQFRSFQVGRRMRTCKISLLNLKTMMFCILRYLTTHSMPRVLSVS